MTAESGGERRSTAVRRRRLRPLLMVLLGLVIFGSGLIIGSVGALTVVRRTMVRAVKHPERLPDRAVERMTSRYGLTEQQQGEVEVVLRRRMERMAAIRQQLRPHLDAELDSLQEDVAPLLDDEQEVRWREDFTRLRNAIQVPMHAPLTVPDSPAEVSPPPGE